MGAITIGKGSRDRVKDRLKFKKRFGDINWTHESKATKVLKVGGKTRYTYSDKAKSDEVKHESI